MTCPYFVFSAYVCTPHFVDAEEPSLDRRLPMLMQPLPPGASDCTLRRQCGARRVSRSMSDSLVRHSDCGLPCCGQHISKVGSAYVCKIFKICTCHYFAYGIRLHVFFLHILHIVLHILHIILHILERIFIFCILFCILF